MYMLFAAAARTGGLAVIRAELHCLGESWITGERTSDAFPPRFGARAAQLRYGHFQRGQSFLNTGLCRSHHSPSPDDIIVILAGQTMISLPLPAANGRAQRSGRRCWQPMERFVAGALGRWLRPAGGGTGGTCFPTLSSLRSAGRQRLSRWRIHTALGVRL